MCVPRNALWLIVQSVVKKFLQGKKWRKASWWKRAIIRTVLQSRLNAYQCLHELYPSFIFWRQLFSFFFLPVPMSMARAIAFACRFLIVRKAGTREFDFWTFDFTILDVPFINIEVNDGKRVRSNSCIATVKELRELTYERKEMHKAVCAECGKECEVPFKPDGSRPVYCRECYAKRAPPRRNRY